MKPLEGITTGGAEVAAGGTEVAAGGAVVAGSAESEPQAARTNVPIATARPITAGLNRAVVKPNRPP